MQFQAAESLPSISLDPFFKFNPNLRAERLTGAEGGGIEPEPGGSQPSANSRNQFDFQARYSRRFILLAVQGRFGGNQFDDDQNTLLLRRYFTLDATASHHSRHGLEVFASVENLLNQRYDVGRTPVLTVGPPILARAGLRLQFGSR